MVLNAFTQNCYVVWLGLLLTGCASVESNEPIFDSADVVQVSSVPGNYGTPEGSFIIKQQDKSYRAVLLVDQNKRHSSGNEYLAVETAEFDLVRLDGEDLALQIRCVAFRDEKRLSKWSRLEKTVAYGVAATARLKGSYWLGTTYPATISPALARRHRIEPQVYQREPDWHSRAAKTEIVSKIVISPRTPKSEVRAFFVDWKNALLADGGDSMLPIWRKGDEPADAMRSAMVSAPQCKDVSYEPKRS